jgi:predicted ATPase/class 3 adenylate cyclase
VEVSTTDGAVVGGLPSGTVIMLLTDIEGSTRILREIGDDRYGRLLADHHRLVIGAGRARGGWLVDTHGDAVFMVFTHAANAVNGAVAAQCALQTHVWPVPALRVRMGLHTGTIDIRETGYIGAALHVAARITDAANGDQILVSSVTADLVLGALPPGTTMADLGVFQLRDVAHPMRLLRVQNDELRADDRPPRARADRPAGANLPVELTTFVGRHGEMNELAQLVPTHRLLTLTGIGGIGKTRVAVEAARQVAGDFDDSVFFVPLSSILQPSQVLNAVAERVGARTEGVQSVVDTVLDRLGMAHCLLVIDNFEHVIDAAPVIGTLLERCPHLHVLATSRQPLGLRGEQEFPIAPLALPDAGYTSDQDVLIESPAIQLFVDRARARRPGFRLDERTTPAVVELCRRLDGIPLAIELAAARAGVLPSAEMLQRLSTLDVSAQSIDTPARHRTLRATLDWSENLLHEDERLVAARLTVFAGGGDLDAVEYVCRDENVHNVIDVLFALADKSLVGIETQTTGDARCFMLETVRTYMLERLVEREGEQAARERHVAWFRDFCARCDYISHPDAHKRWPSLEVNIDNVRAAIAWCLDEGDLASLGVLAASLWSWSWLTGRVAETRAWIEAAIAAATSQEPDRATLARLNFAAGASRFNTGDYEQAESVLRDAWQKARELCDPDLSWAAEGLLGLTLPHLGRLDEAWQHIEHAYQECEAKGAKWGAGYTASALGSLNLLVRGDSTAAASLHERSLELAKDIGAVLLEAQAHTQLAYLDMSRADVPSAWCHLGIAADLYNRNPHQEGVSYCLDTMAILLFSSGDVAQAAKLHVTAEATRASLRMPVWPILRPLLDGFGEQLRNALGEEQFVLALEQSTAQNALDLLVTVAEAHRPDAGTRVLGDIASRRRPAAWQQRSSEDVS